MTKNVKIAIGLGITALLGFILYKMGVFTKKTVVKEDKPIDKPIISGDAPPINNPKKGNPQTGTILPKRKSVPVKVPVIIRGRQYLVPNILGEAKATLGTKGLTKIPQKLKDFIAAAQQAALIAQQAQTDEEIRLAGEEALRIENEAKEALRIFNADLLQMFDPFISWNDMYRLAEALGYTDRTLVNEQIVDGREEFEERRWTVYPHWKDIMTDYISKYSLTLIRPLNSLNHAIGNISNRDVLLMASRVLGSIASTNSDGTLSDVSLRQENMNNGQIDFYILGMWLGYSQPYLVSFRSQAANYYNALQAKYPTWRTIIYNFVKNANNGITFQGSPYTLTLKVDPFSIP